jgi:hypothetical protein
VSSFQQCRLARLLRCIGVRRERLANVATSSPGICVSKTGIAFRRNLIRLEARNDMQTDYRQTSSEVLLRTEAIAEQLILWGVIATVIFLAVTMIRAT